MLWFTWRAFRKTKGRHRIWQAVRRSKDPTPFTVFLEGSAALIGIGIAMAGTAVSVAIGVLLAGGAVVLARESKQLQAVTGGRDRRRRGYRSTSGDSWRASQSPTYLCPPGTETARLRSPVSLECKYVQTRGTLPVNSLIWHRGSIHDERRTRHSKQAECAPVVVPPAGIIARSTKRVLALKRGCESLTTTPSQSRGLPP